jgi:hypothetical protein
MEKKLYRKTSLEEDQNTNARNAKDTIPRFIRLKRGNEKIISCIDDDDSGLEMKEFPAFSRASILNVEPDGEIDKNILLDKFKFLKFIYIFYLN